MMTASRPVFGAHHTWVGRLSEKSTDGGRPSPPILIIPGIDGSGPAHWQSHWEADLPTAERVNQADWSRPTLAEWTASLAESVRAAPGAILVAHSLGCVLVAHLAQVTGGRGVAGALLVAPADVDHADRAIGLAPTFSPAPLLRLPFPSLVVASRNDPYVEFGRAAHLAEAWGADIHDSGLAGHINADAGYGPWPEGRDLLASIIQRAGETRIG